MILDTSALIAIIDRGPGHEHLRSTIETAPRVAISTATLVELTAVLQRYGRPGIHRFVDRALADWRVETVPFDEEQSQIARAAYRDYGRGSRHPARLNLGDCFSYALAIARDEPLLFVGDDFGHTDVRRALDPGIG